VQVANEVRTFAGGDLCNVLEKVTSADTGIARFADSALSRMRLTRKEEQVARLVLKELTSKEIAALLDDTEKTIKEHLTCLYGKLGVSGRAEFCHFVFPS
jgi:DNA-binding CsgD family transcriptional regulator